MRSASLATPPLAVSFYNTGAHSRFLCPCVWAAAAVRAADPERALLLPGGRHYVGAVAQGRPHGEGQAFRADGVKEASGDWEDGQLHGTGAKTQPSGDHYEGKFVAGQMSGLGSLTVADGTLYEGEFAADKRSGLGVQWDKDGKLIRCGRWVDGELVESCPVPRSKVPVGSCLSAAGERHSREQPDSCDELQRRGISSDSAGSW